jgi:hypothetical protein
LNIFERCEATGHVHEVLNTADWKEYLPQPLHSVMGRLSLVYGLCGSYMVGSVIRHNDVYCFLEHLMFMWTGQAIFQHINCGMLCFLCVLWNHFSLVELVQVHTELTEHPTTVYFERKPCWRKKTTAHCIILAVLLLVYKPERVCVAIEEHRHKTEVSSVTSYPNRNFLQCCLLLWAVSWCYW